MTGKSYARLFASDDRAVSEVIGAILVFGLLIALLAIVQTQAVPATNEKVEFEHSQRVQTDMSEMQEAIALTAAQGRSQSPSIELGLTYPARLVFFNPSPVYGQLRTNSSANVTLANVNSTEGVNLLYTGNPGKEYNYTTRPVEYRAGYHRFADEPTIVREVGTLYERYPEGTRVQSGSFVNGKQITLVTVNGSLQENSLSTASVETVPLSAPARTVAVRNETGENLEITVPTQLDNGTWTQVLRPQYDQNGGHIVDQSYTESSPYNRLTITLERGVTYKLRTARVGLGSKLDEPGPAYLTTISGDDESVVDNGVLKVTVEVRDRLNNPVAGKKVNLSIVESASGPVNGSFDPSSKETTTTVTTAADGRATVTYHPPNVLGGTRDVDIRASADSVPPNAPSGSFDLSARNNTTVDVEVVDTGGPIGTEPTANIDGITDKSSPSLLEIGDIVLSEGAAAFEIDWSASDPDGCDPNSELDTVEVRLTNDTTNRVVDFATYDVDCGSADDIVTLFEEGDHCGKPYRIKVIVEDKGDFVRETMQTETATC